MAGTAWAEVERTMAEELAEAPANKVEVGVVGKETTPIDAWAVCSAPATEVEKIEVEVEEVASPMSLLLSKASELQAPGEESL